MSRTENGDPVLGIVIPAYQGADTIDRSLRSLAGQTFRGPLHVVVAVNDGRADTANAAMKLLAPLRRAGAQCTVLETDKGRDKAINAAERKLPPGPRLYLDQDAKLSPNAISALSARLDPATRIHFAALIPQIAPSKSRVTRAYYDAWSDLPYVRESPATMGAYAVSAAGRTRWAEFPVIHSDDKFVRMHFSPNERSVVDETYEVLTPDNIRDLVRARRRYIRGNRELTASGLAPREEQDVPRYTDIARHVSRRPSKWPGFAAFITIYGAATAAEAWKGHVAKAR